MIGMAKNPDDVVDQIEQAYKMAAPVSEYAQPTQMTAVNPHDTLTVPLGPPAPKVTGMAASAGTDTAPPSSESPKMSALAPQKEHISKNLMADYKKDEDPYGSPDNHPGFFGKLLHGLNVATGGVNRRGFEEQGLEKRLQDIGKQESTENLQGAQAGNQTAEAGEHTETTNEMPGKTASEEGLQGATARHLNDESNALENPQPNLTTAYAHRVNEVIKAGGDPSQDPIVQHLSDAITSLQKPVSPKGQEHVSLLGDEGKPIEANFHPDTGKYTDTAGNEIKNPRPVPPPPNYGQLILPTKVETVIDPQTGVPTVMQYDPRSQTYSRPVGMSATNAYGHEAAQAGAVNRAGSELITELQNPANRAILGKLSSYIKQGTLGTPVADKQAAYLSSQLKTFAALQPAMHGFRSKSAGEAFEKMIGGLAQDPDATIASIQGILDTAGAINPGLKHGGNNAPPARPANVPEGYEFNQNGAQGAGWYKPKPKGKQ